MTDTDTKIRVEIDSGNLISDLAKSIKLEVEKSEPITVPMVLAIGKDIFMALSEKFQQWANTRGICAYLVKTVGLERHLDVYEEALGFDKEIDSSDLPKEIKDLLHNMLKEAVRNAKNAH